MAMSAMGMGRSMNDTSMHGTLHAVNDFSRVGPRGLGASSEASSGYNIDNNNNTGSFPAVTTVLTKGGGGIAGTPCNPDRNDDKYGGGCGRAGNPSAQRQRQLRRQSSNSSLDVAATIFSSIQSLEANGGSLASLGVLGSDSGGGVGNHFALSGSAPAPSTWNDFRSSNLNNFSSNAPPSNLHNLHFGGLGGDVNLASLAGIGMMGLGDGISGGNSASRLFGTINGSNYNSGGLNRFAGRLATLSRSNSNNSLRSHFEEIMANGGYGVNAAFEGSGSVGASNSCSGSNPFGNLSYIPTSSRNFLEAQQYTHNILARQRQFDEDLLLSGNSATAAGFPFSSFVPTTNNKSDNASRNSNNSRSLLENFSQEELLNEVLSRRSSRTLLDEMSRCSSRNDFSEFLGVGIGGGGIQRQTSLGSHHSLTALLASATNAEQVTGSTGTGGLVLGETMTVPTSNFSRGDEEEELPIPRVIVSTKLDDGPSSKSRSSGFTTLSKSKSDISKGKVDKESNTSTVVTAESGKAPSSRNSISKKRSNSTSSFDALLSVFGDELAELDKERKAKDDDDKSTTSSLGFFSNVMIEAAEAESELASARKDVLKNFNRDNNQHSLARIPNQDVESDYEGGGGESSRRESISTDSGGEDKKPSSNKNQGDLGDTPTAATVRAKAQKNFFDTVLGREKKYLNEPGGPNQSSLLTNTMNPSTVMPTVVDSSNSIHKEEDIIAALQSSSLHGNLPVRMLPMPGISTGTNGITTNVVSPLERSILLRQLASNNINLSDEAVAQLLQTRRLPFFQADNRRDCPNATSSQTDVPPEPIPSEEVAQPSNPEPVPTPEPKRPPVEEFLEKYGESAEKSKEGMLKAISDSEESLAAIHAWDRSQGLRKCHSRTVVKTRRTRARIKAFLMGLKPPQEPTRNRKRKVKDVHVDVDGTTNDESSPTLAKKKKKGPMKLTISSSKVDQ